jgi:hypothetical protein
MANIITFTFKSDAPWSENELDTLNSELAAVAKDMDDDHVEASFNTTCVDESDNEAETKRIREAAIELASSGTLVVNVSLVDEEADDELFSSGEIRIAQ